MGGEVKRRKGWKGKRERMEKEGKDHGGERGEEEGEGKKEKKKEKSVGRVRSGEETGKRQKWNQLLCGFNG